MKKEEFEKLVQAAREADLVHYFQSSGYTVQKRGSEFYVKEFPGLCIKPDSNQWFHHYTNTGRTGNSLDCLTLIVGRDFKQAVYELTGNDVTTTRSTQYEKSQAPQYTSPPRVHRNPPADRTAAPAEKKELRMPEQADNMRRMFAYFCQSRKIPAAIVEELVHAKLLYQSENTVNSTVNGVAQTFKNANAVFVHRDSSGKEIGGEVQGCNSFKRYKGVVAGTGDSAFMFTPVPAKDGKVKRAYIFESAIDMMSFYTFCDKKKLEGVAFVSMAGLKPTVPKKLQAEGVQIISCVDNDDAGRRFEAENGFVRSESVKSLLDNLGFKDWNELLVFKSDNPDADLLKGTAVAEKQIEKKPFFARGHK